MDSECSSEPFAILGDRSCSYHSIHFSPDGSYIAAGTNQGRIDIFHVATSKKYVELHKKTNLDKETTFTCVRWRETSSELGLGLKNVICSTNTHGEIQQWHIPTGRILNTANIKVGPGEDPQLSNLAYSHNFTRIAVCGAEPQIRVYDTRTMEKTHLLDGMGGIDEVGHSNRVFCVKFFSEDDTHLVSGGWDQRIILWDLTTGLPIHSLNTQSINGDAIDVYKGTMLSCSSINEGRLSMYDIKNFKKITNSFGKEALRWEHLQDENYDEDDEDEQNPEARKDIKFYTGKFSNKGAYVLVGASNPNEARIIHTDKGKTILRIKNCEKGIITSDWNRDCSKFAISGEEGIIRMYDIRLPQEGAY